MKTKSILVICSMGLLLTACSTTSTLYSWHDYENKSYKYQKTSTDESYNQALKEYLKIIQKQSGTRKTVPPGINAEYGYMLYKAGKQEEGLKYFKQEVSLYPESEIYISRIIKQLEK